MNQSLLSAEISPIEKKSPKFSGWFIAIISIGLSCLVIACAMLPVFKVSSQHGTYDIKEVIVSSGLKDNEPVNVKSTFKPSDTIICTVKTTGVDGIIGMRWLLDDNVIYEVTGETQNNTISSYIKSSSSAILSEGKYRVEIFMVKEPIETAYFEIKIYHPTVSPPITIPAGHKSIELPWFPEVPFAFDEIWKIDGTEWKVNEVKVVLKDDTQEQFIAILISANMKDIKSLSENQAKQITRPIALYALENGYVENAKGLEIDGKHYDLDQSLFVILLNPSTQQVYRVQFTMDELK